MNEVHYCIACMKKSVLDQSKHHDCPNCGIDNFMLLRAGQFGTAMHFDRSGLTSEDFDWFDDHYGKYCADESVKIYCPEEKKSMDSIAYRLRQNLGA